MVPVDAAEYLEALEDAADVIAARRALAEEGPSVAAEQLWAASEALCRQPRPPGAVKLAGTADLWVYRGF